MTPAEAADLTLAGARRAIASGALDPVELLEACLGRIHRTEPVVSAWVALDREGARSRARSSDRTSGPLAGIPLGVKDVIDVEGLPTTASSKVLAGNVARSSAPAVGALSGAGAVVLGKTNTQEFAYGAVTPPTANPWDPGRIPGGSSGGSAAALAAGHCLAALGTDTAGSIRIPAALCGVSGLKPRPGIVSLEGVVPLAPSLDTLGPMARTVEDLIVLWEVLSGRPVLVGPAPDLAVPAAGTLPELEPDVAAAYAAAVEALRPLCGGIVEAAVPPFSSFDLPRACVLMPEALQVHRSRGWWPERAADYTEETRGYLRHAERMSGERIEAGRRECARLAARLIDALAGRVLATPTVPCEAPTHAEAAEAQAGSPRRPAVMKLTRIPGPINAAGLAALSIPCGFTSAGLPVGLQLAGFDEPTLLGLGLAFQRETGWHRRRPPGPGSP